MKLIERKAYLDQLQAVKGIPDIKVITGIRRSGKSKLMDAFIASFPEDEQTSIIRIKLNLKSFERLRDADKLYSYISSKYVEHKNNYLFVDEIQLCHGFEWVINSLYEEEKYDIYLTGSNAFLLSSDLATLFGGRVFEIRLFPFSFAEYLQYYPSENLDGSFDSFVKDGGMAGSYLYRRTEDARKYVENIFKTRISDELLGLMVMIIEKNHYKHLVSVFDHFTECVKEYKNIGTAYITSAVELSDEQKKAIEKRLLDTTRYVEIEMKFDVDAALIGGMKIRIGDRVVDSSVKTKLEDLTRELTKIQLKVGECAP